MKHVLLSILLLGFAGSVAAQDVAAEKPFTVEYYYKIKWGHFEEWLDLYKKNHWPFIDEAIKSGHMLSAVVHRPVNHAGEQDRWDLRVTITYKNIIIAHGLDDFDAEAAAKALFPDQATFAAEEKRRFQLLEEHMDVEVFEMSTDGWR